MFSSSLSAGPATAGFFFSFFPHGQDLCVCSSTCWFLNLAYACVTEQNQSQDIFYCIDYFRSQLLLSLMSVFVETTFPWMLACLTGLLLLATAFLPPLSTSWTSLPLLQWHPAKQFCCSVCNDFHFFTTQHHFRRECPGDPAAPAACYVIKMHLKK